MKSYGQFCPVAKAAEVFCERWTALILRDLAGGATRFSELRRGVPLMSPTLLSQRLKQLEAEGIVERREAATGRGGTYHLTPAGLEFAPLVEALGVWGQRWARRDLAEGEIDLGLLVWGMENTVRADAFGRDPSVVEMELTDQPPDKRHWWFLHQAGATQLCLEHPGFDVDLYLSVSLPDMIYIWRGDLTPEAAIDQDRLELIGNGRDRRRFRTWLNLSPLTKIKSKRVGV